MSPFTDTNRRMTRVWTLLLGALVACEQTTNLAWSHGHGDGGMDAQVEEEAGADSGNSIATTEAGTSVALCGSRPCQCSNGVDDDHDGQPDGFDSECTGPYDDYEDSFRVNDVNEGNPKCTDCFYDGNPGSGDDGCDIATECTFSGKPGNGGGSCRTCTPSATCIDNCQDITPNGCDCFGCCDVIHAGKSISVRLVESCKVELIDDAKACPRCTLSMLCQNPCGPCEICPGRTRADLPAECMADGGVGYSCEGRSPCERSGECQPEEYCGQGCCVPILL